MFGGLGSRSLWRDRRSHDTVHQHGVFNDTLLITQLTDSSPGPTGRGVLPPPVHTAACQGARPMDRKQQVTAVNDITANQSDDSTAVEWNVQTLSQQSRLSTDITAALQLLDDITDYDISLSLVSESSPQESRL